MSIGKYSPTVSYSYRIDQDWWEKYGGGWRRPEGFQPYFGFDYDGYDEYGYNAQGLDRAGHAENEYLLDAEMINGEWEHTLYDDVLRDYAKVFLGKKED